MKTLRDIGNTVIVVEHDQEAIESADFVVDMGPGAGEHGGQVVATGTPERDRTQPSIAHRPVPVRQAQRPMPLLRNAATAGSLAAT